MQATIAGGRVNGVFARRIGGNDNGSSGSGLTARTKNPSSAAAVGRGRPGAFEMLLPNEFTLVDVDRKKIIGNTRYDGNLLRSAAGRCAADDKRHKQGMHLTGLVIKFQFPEQRCLPYRCR